LNNFFRRTLTGAWIVIFVLGGFWLHPVTFFLTGLALLAGSQYEYYLMIRNTGVRPQIIPGMVTGAAAYIISTLVASGMIPVKYLLAVTPLMLVLMVIELFRREEKPFDSLAHTFFPVIYIVLPFCLFPFSAFGHSGLDSLIPHKYELFSPGIVVGFLILLWTNDTGAYLTGISIGRHRLMERISPKKSWEGFFGGLILTLAAGWLLSVWLGVVDKKGWLIISVIISISGTFGDLIESMLKRSIGVKDSGTIMPGHGGFLDRFDSAIASFPLVFLFLALFG
jgi:phosphatidate cytidylyltransferase